MTAHAHMTSASIDFPFSPVDLRPNAPSILVLLPCRCTFLLHALHRPALFFLRWRYDSISVHGFKLFNTIFLPPLALCFKDLSIFPYIIQT